MHQVDWRAEAVTWLSAAGDYAEDSSLRLAFVVAAHGALSFLIEDMAPHESDETPLVEAVPGSPTIDLATTTPCIDCGLVMAGGFEAHYCKGKRTS